MINQLTIKNFKSIRSLQMPCKKINVFIGEPNSGKSNIIEALALQSQNAIDKNLNKDIFRYKNIADLFYDFGINSPIEVQTDNKLTSLLYPIRENGVPENRFYFYLDKNRDELKSLTPITIEHNGAVSNHGNLNETTNVHFYEFKRLNTFQIGYMPHLTVPHGNNLPSLLLANASYKKWVSEFFQSKGLRLTLKPTENDIEISKFTGNEIYSYPYNSVSETLQRVVFYMMAILSNKNAVILLDEPESNTFPFYTKYIAECIALDDTNQFFITTHNPYLLLSLIEKTKVEDINVCITEMKNYETTITVLDSNQISKVLDLNSDVFFNFNQLID